MGIQVFLFANSKCKCYFHNRLKPAKLAWTAVYRKQHKKVSPDEFDDLSCYYVYILNLIVLMMCSQRTVSKLGYYS
jgi:hypothetical protein